MKLMHQCYCSSIDLSYHGAIGHVYLQCVTMRYLSHVEILDDVLRVHAVEHVEEILFVNVQNDLAVLLLVVAFLGVNHHHVVNRAIVQCQFHNFLN